MCVWGGDRLRREMCSTVNIDERGIPCFIFEFIYSSLNVLLTLTLFKAL